MLEPLHRRRNPMPVASMKPSVTDKSQITAPLIAHRSAPINGRARVPGDKSISHRALLIGLLTVGETSIEGLLEGDDVLATARACKQFGAAIERKNPGAWRIAGVGIGALLEPAGVVDFGNAGTGVRLAMGMTAGHPVEVVFDGDASLRRRPMRRVLEPLMRMGADVLEQTDGARLPPNASSFGRTRARISLMRGLNPFTSKILKSLVTNAEDAIGVLLGLRGRRIRREWSRSGSSRRRWR